MHWWTAACWIAMDSNDSQCARASIQYINLSSSSSSSLVFFMSSFDSIYQLVTVIVIIIVFFLLSFDRIYQLVIVLIIITIQVSHLIRIVLRFNISTCHHRHHQSFLSFPHYIIDVTEFNRSTHHRHHYDFSAPLVLGLF